MNDKYWICHTCKQYLIKGTVPPISHYNNLEIYTEEKHCILTDEEKEILKSLSQLEQTLIALNVPFQLVYQTPVSRWRATKGRVTNVPLPQEKVLETIKSIPRTRNERAIVSVELKKKKGMKKPTMSERIDPEKLHAALKILKKLGNEHYKDIADNVEQYIEGIQRDDPEFYESFILHPQAMFTEQENQNQTDANQEEDIENNVEGNNPPKTAEEINEEEIEEFNKNYAVQRQTFSDPRPTRFVNDFPEIDIQTVRINNDENLDHNITVTVAPGENQVPTNIVHEKHWEAKSYLGLFPDGNNY